MHIAARTHGARQPQWDTHKACHKEEVHLQRQLSSQVGCLQLGTLGLQACRLRGALCSQCCCMQGLAAALPKFRTPTAHAPSLGHNAATA